MSFGFSVNDFITLGTLAWNVYKSCKEAPESFGNISAEILSLHVVLKEAEEVVFAAPVTSERRARIEAVTDGCHCVVTDLQNLVQRYQGLDTQCRRTWDRLKWYSEDIAELRFRLIANATLLTALISTCQFTVEKQLHAFIRESNEGKREGSVISTQTVDSLSPDEREVWRNIRKELEGAGITVAAFETNKDFILSWLREAIATGAFGWQTFNSASATVPFELPFAEESPGFLVTKSPSASHMPPHTKVKRPKLSIALFQKSSIGSPRIPQVPALAANRLLNKLRWNNLLNDKLLNAARTGDLLQVKELLSSGVNVNSHDPESRTTALHEAAMNGRFESLQLLLEQGADVNAKDLSGDTALHLASSNAHNEAVQLLLEKGAHINASNTAGYTALHEAVFQAHNSTVLLLLQNRADIDAKGNGEDTALHLVAREGHKELALLLLQNGASTKEENCEGWLAVHDAAWEGHKAIISLLLDNGVNVDTQDAYGGSVLQFVSYRGYIDIVLMLLSRGADVNLKSVLRKYIWDGDNESYERIAEHRTPLHEAAWAGQRAIVEVLLKNGADLQATDQRGRTALHCAARNGHLETVKLLVQHGASTEARQVYGETALEEAVSHGHEPVITLLSHK